MRAPTRMFLTLCLPAVFVGCATVFAAIVWNVLPDISSRGPLRVPVQDTITLAGAAVAMLLYWATVWRFRKWERGCSACCKTCGCALGRTRETPEGTTRSCLGCGTMHPV